MLTLHRVRNRPEPPGSDQALVIEHLREMGRFYAADVLSDEAYGALLTIAASRAVMVDAYSHGMPPREWRIECYGGTMRQRGVWTPEQWQRCFDFALADLYRAGRLTGESWKLLCVVAADHFPNGSLSTAFGYPAVFAPQDYRWVRILAAPSGFNCVCCSALVCTGFDAVAPLADQRAILDVLEADAPFVPRSAVCEGCAVRVGVPIA